MKRLEKIGLLFLLVVVASWFLLPAGTSGKTEDKKEDKKGTLVTGTGNLVAQVTRTSKPLDPPCVAFGTHVGNVSFSGLIENALEDGDQEIRTVLDGCSAPFQGTTMGTYTLAKATVAGRTGGLILEVRGIFELEPFSRNRYHFTIRGVSGDLKRATGAGVLVGEGSPTRVFSTYYAEILLPDDDD
jgi:hypothetical protein